MWILFAVALVLGIVVTIKNSVPYFLEYRNAPFVIDKWAVAHTQPWKAFLLIHVVSAIAALAICVLQIIPVFRRWCPNLHRWFGILFAAMMFLFVLPSGFYLAVHAKGGATAQAGFLFNGLLALCFLILGLRSAKRKDYLEHGAWMVRVFAMIVVAITFRFLYVGLFFVGSPPFLNYNLALWGGILVNYFVAERFIGRTLSKPVSQSSLAH